MLELKDVKCYQWERRPLVSHPELVVVVEVAGAGLGLWRRATQTVTRYGLLQLHTEREFKVNHATLVKL